MIRLVRICVSIVCLSGAMSAATAQPKIQLSADADGTVDTRGLVTALEQFLPVQEGYSFYDPGKDKCYEVLLDLTMSIEASFEGVSVKHTIE